jgi:hypothetical protein
MKKRRRANTPLAVLQESASASSAQNRKDKPPETTNGSSLMSAWIGAPPSTPVALVFKLAFLAST